MRCRNVVRAADWQIVLDDKMPGTKKFEEVFCFP